MLTPEQEEWVNSLSDRIITVVPYDPRTERLFLSVKKKVQDVLGTDVRVEHCGASSLGISGQDEIDVSIIVSKDRFGEYASKLDGVVGSVASWYPDRVRFELKEEGKKIDLKIIDDTEPSYMEGKIFEGYLRAHPDYLEKYRILKEESNGLTVKEYYRKKKEFINEVNSRA